MPPAHLIPVYAAREGVNPFIPGTRLNSNKLNMEIGALNTISDIEAFLVPALATWQLNMDVKEILEVFAVFTVGTL